MMTVDLGLAKQMVMIRTRRIRADGSPESIRSAKVLFSRRMAAVRKICEELEEIESGIPRLREDQIDRLIVTGLDSDTHFRGVLNAAIFFLSQACLMSDEQTAFTRSRAKEFVLNSHVVRGMENAARNRRR